MPLNKHSMKPSTRPPLPWRYWMWCLMRFYLASLVGRSKWPYFGKIFPVASAGVLRQTENNRI